jgi:hypothetical protein
MTESEETVPSLPDWIEEAISEAEGVIRLDGYDDCIVGVSDEFGGVVRLVYDRRKIITKLTADGMEEGDAVEWFDYNIIGGYYGPGGPVFIIASPPAPENE